MRRLIAVALVGLACAQPGMPPGGPPDVAAPQIIGITPDSGAVGVKPKEVLFKFDEVVSERPPSTTSLSDLFLISPRDGVPDASWHRDAIGVRPSHGWRANTPYTVILMRGLADIRGNVRNTGASTFFSTGTAIPRTRISGVAFDWVAGTPAAGALVEAIVEPDTLHPYVALVDSLGRFAIEHLPANSYTLKAYLDRNKNLSVDPSEAWDSTNITLADSAGVQMLLFVHDTLPPRLRDVRQIDSTAVRLSFDKPIDPTQTLTNANFAVIGPDSLPVPIQRVGPPPKDTTGPAVPAPTPARAPVIGRNPAGAARRAPQAQPDTTPRPVLPKPSPTSEVEVKLQRPLVAKTAYRVRAIGIRGLLGRTGDSERVYTVPAPTPPPAARAAADSTKAPPTAPVDTAKPPTPTTRPGA